MGDHRRQHPQKPVELVPAQSWENGKSQADLVVKTNGVPARKPGSPLGKIKELIATLYKEFNHFFGEIYANNKGTPAQDQGIVKRTRSIRNPLKEAVRFLLDAAAVHEAAAGAKAGENAEKQAESGAMAPKTSEGDTEEYEEVMIEEEMEEEELEEDEHVEPPSCEKMLKEASAEEPSAPLPKEPIFLFLCPVRFISFLSMRSCVRLF